ncbi:MAG: ribose-phosphate diphosphokinase [Porticoccaceae bacterium]|nr:ribose-phosphate diphosphokinase [Porticoccaceae bacterium]
MLILGFPESLTEAQLLADSLQATMAAVDIHRFPDGESLVTLPPQLPDTVVFLRGLHDPNSKLIELYLAIATAKSLGCRRAILVTPYLCYMRQDKVFHQGQGISQQIIGDLLSGWVDDLITVDPHLHRIANLFEALPHCRSQALSAAPLLGDYLRNRGLGSSDCNGVLVGPDAESRQWVAQVAERCGLDYVVASKIRSGDRSVQVTLPDYSYAGKEAILVDDVISSGNTMMEAARQLHDRGAVAVSAICTHGLFAPGAEAAMASAGINPVITTNAIPHSSNKIDLSPLLANAIKTLVSSRE